MITEAEQLGRCSISDVMGRFESLGGWCGLPKLQKRFGTNHLGLLRYAGLTVPDLTEAIFNGFAGLGDPEHIFAFNPETSHDTWDVYDGLYRIWWHTGRTIRDGDASSIEAFETRRLPFLARKFLEIILMGSKIMVLPVACSDLEVDAVSAALALWGNVQLLFASQICQAPVGSVERLSDRLLRGSLDYTPDEDRGTDDAWLSVLANAYCLS